MYTIKKQKKSGSWVEIIGWVGVFMGLGAYTLIVFRIVDATNYWYLGLNTIGSALLVIEMSTKKDWQAVTIHTVVGVFAFINLILLIMSNFGL